MKTKVEKEPIAFTPINITIKIESKEDLNDFYNWLGQQTFLTELYGEIHKLINE